MQTIFSKALRIANLLGLDYTCYPNSTLNEFYGVGSATTKTNPKIRYFGLGVKMQGANRNPETLSNLNPNTRTPINITVQTPVPFIMVEADSDITTEERTKYRLRLIHEIGGVVYVAYYLKKFKIEPMNYFTVNIDNQGGRILGPFEKDVNDMLLNGGSMNNHVITNDIDDKEFVAVSTTCKMELTVSEIANIALAIDLLYPNAGDIDRTTIGELCLFSGEENEDGDLNGVQAALFLDTNINLIQTATTGFTNITDIGGMELLKVDGL